MQDQPRTRPAELRDVGIHAAVTIGLAIVIAVIGVNLSGTAQDVLLLVAPAVVAVGGLAAAARTFQVNKAGGRWQIWQACMWLLMFLFLFWFMTTLPVVLAD